MFPKEAERFPSSAELFKFCKEVLYIKNHNKAKITDQDVGALLDFDPADCTHWKHGRKNIKSISNLSLLAKKLEIDLRTVLDIVQGRNDFEQALLSYNGFGSFAAPSEMRRWIVAKTLEMLETAKIKTLPVHIPEFLDILPQISLKEVDASSQEPLVVCKKEQETYIISCRKTNFHGCIRFLIAREIAYVVMSQDNEAQSLGVEAREVIEPWLNLFAIHLLMPSQMLQIATLQAKANC
ncbi:MAG: hypothetical protein K2X39_05685, partial [Silvanigrellaceae bacterium]|nr:hypothetical protein [Silvanigrellaceae bacterium]